MSQAASQMRELPDLTVQVTVVLGDEDSQPARFTVPQSLLVESSEFFQNECRKYLNSAYPRVIHLSEVEPEVFTHYLMSIYRGTVAVAKHDLSENEDARQFFGDLVKLWLLTHRLENNQLCNDAADTIVDTVEEYEGGCPVTIFPPSLTVLIWCGTMANYALRRLVRDFYFYCVWSKDIKAQTEQFPIGFYKDVMIMAMEKCEDHDTKPYTLQDIVDDDRCIYHDHDDQELIGSCAAQGEGAPSDSILQDATLAANFDLLKEVTLIINEDDPQHVATFAVPEHMLTEKSEFFEAACRNGWKEATTRVIRIPDVDNSAFHAYLYWVYRARVAVSPDPYIAPQSSAMATPTLDRLTELWLLADRFADTQLRNATMDALRGVTHSFHVVGDDWAAAFTPPTIARIWSATTRGRALRRYIVDVYAGSVTAPVFDPIKDAFPPDFIMDLLLKTMREGHGNRKMNGTRKRLSPLYHEHDDDEGLCCKEEGDWLGRDVSESP